MIIKLLMFREIVQTIEQVMTKINHVMFKSINLLFFSFGNVTLILFIFVL